MTQVSTDHSRATLAGDHSHGSAPAADKADKPRSFELSAFPIPGGREEDWRFTPIARMADLFADELTGSAPDITFDGVRLDEGAADLPFDVDFASCPCVGSVGAPSDRTAVVAWANRGTPTCVTISESLERPYVFEIVGNSSEAAAQHLTLNITEGVTATVVLRHTGTARLTQTVEIDVAEGANLTVVTTQEWDEDAVHAAAHRISAGKDAVVKHIAVTLGADLVRLTTDVEFAGEGADVELLGLYFTDAGQHHEHRLFMEHRLPNCVSDATYKGALQGKDAHAVWVGDVLIGHDAVPNLEIETGEIAGAGHASATGRFDDEQLFYLMSRGVPEDLARRLVVRGFFAELINRIGVPEVQDRLIAAIEAELDQTMALVK